MIIQTPRGTKDIYGDEVLQWQHLEKEIREICEIFGYGEIRTPVFEHTELFSRGVGEGTDVVQKEMYTFMDKGDRSITLKPEGTAGAARAYIEHKLYGTILPIKFYYVTPIFRYEKPAAGRMRQFHQFGIEAYGSQNASCDVEVISVAHELFKKLGIKNVKLFINSLGCSTCRQTYNDALKVFIKENLDSLCDTCKERYEKNPLRVLDCKNEACKEVLKPAPSILEYLDDECRGHFEEVQKLLASMNIPFEVDGRIVRGLDYYTRTVFEFILVSEEDKNNVLGSQNTICGGGRYNNLVEELGGPSTGCVGFSIGMERILITLTDQNNLFKIENKKQIFIGFIGEEGYVKAQTLIYQLRQKGISAEGDILNRSVKAQLKYADKIGAKFSTVIGDEEIQNNSVTIKNMETGEKQIVDMGNVHMSLGL